MENLPLGIWFKTSKQACQRLYLVLLFADNLYTNLSNHTSGVGDTFLFIVSRYGENPLLATHVMTPKLALPQYTAVTSRVKDWLGDPDGRLPVSCTVMDVTDTMEGTGGIEESWIFASKALRNGAGVALNLGNLRAKGTDNGKGLVASGPVSFAKIYSTLNEILRRGGKYKNGAITLYLDYDHADAQEFLSVSPKELPWAKRALYVDESLLTSPLLPLVMQKLNEGVIWLAKKQHDPRGKRLFSNVCLEILLPSKGTCLLSHVNLGKTTLAAIPQAFAESMEFLCTLHANTGVGASGIYLAPEQDKQVGLGALGLANLLAIEGVTYRDFVAALEYTVFGMTAEPPTAHANKIVTALVAGYAKASDIARIHGMERAFTIAPTASVAYRYRDREFFTTTPEISPPINHIVDRDSGTFGVVRYEHHPKCEVARQVGWDVQYRLFKAWQALMNQTGLAHSMSFNLWETCRVDHDFLTDWFASPLMTTYYRLNILQDALDKSQVLTPEGMGEPMAMETPACSLNPAEFCAACAE